MGLSIVEGWTGPMDFILKADGVAVDLTGCTVTLLLRDIDGTSRTLTGSVSILDGVNGKIRFSPGVNDIGAAGNTLLARFKVVDSSTKIVYFPSGDADKWEVEQA